MKRFSRIIAMFAMVFASLSYSCYGQDIVNLSHIVQRGETLESLANRYRLTTEMLKTVNLDMDTFYTGLEIVVPVDKKYLCLRSEEDGEMILEDMAGYFSEYQEASRIFDLGNYKKANDLFESTIRNHGKYLPCEEAYFGKAMCAYHRKKWSTAVEGFERVINIEACPKELKEQSRKLMAEAEEQRDARAERTASIFSSLFQVVAEAGTAYMAASQANNGIPGYNYASMPQGTSLGTMNNAEFTNNVNTNLGQLANYSMMQVAMQWKQEEMQMKTGFASSYRQLHGKDPSEEEVQAAYNSYMQSKGNAYQTVQQASSGLYDRELGISSNSSSTSSTSGGYKCKKLSATDKAHCNDTGVCQNCNGSKVTLDMLGNTIECKVCYGKGVCPSCQGRL